MKKLSVLFAFWLFWAFALGSFIVLVPVRQTINYAHTHGWTVTLQQVALFGYMVVLMLLSFSFAKRSSLFVLRSTNNRKLVHTIVPIALVVVSIYLFFMWALITAGK